jgi:hypothetical protein
MLQIGLRKRENVPPTISTRLSSIHMVPGAILSPPVDLGKKKKENLQ